MRSLLSLSVFFPALSVIACSSAPAPSPWSDAALAAEAERYFDDTTYRREAMVASLFAPTNIYSTQRIAAYGHGDRGWDALPEWNPRSLRVDAATAAALEAGGAFVTPDVGPLWDRERPTSLEGWVALGREVFHRYPLRDDVYLGFAVRNPALAEALGVQRAADGSYPGVVVYRGHEGAAEVGVTCALCHSNVRDGVSVEGEARRDLDYGELRLAFHDTTGIAVDEELARRMATWGPGRADITEDDGEDPVAIPDLFGLQEQSHLTHAGTIVHFGPTALAIRLETQLLHANHQRVRPPRELAWALAMYIYSLTPPPPSEVAPADQLAAGAELFALGCGRCHDNAVLGGGLEPAEVIGTDPALASGLARGTGFYRTPALLAVGRAAPYLHDGSVPTLEDLLDEARFTESYARSPIGAGPVPGHRYGTTWPAEDKAALVAYLRSL